MTLQCQNHSTPSWQASSILSGAPFCCHDLLQMWCIARHQLLPAFLRNLSPFLIGKGLQITNIVGFACCNRLLKIPPEIFQWGSSQETVMATLVSLRTSSETKPWWILRYAWDHCPVRRSKDAQASASSQRPWHFVPGFPDTWLNPSCPPHTAGFQCQRKRSSPRASVSHHHVIFLRLQSSLKVGFIVEFG